SSSATAKAAFVDFKNSWNVVFSNELPFALYGTSAREGVLAGTAGQAAGLHLYPVPARGKVTIGLTGFDGGADLRIVSTVGKAVYEARLEGDRAEVDLSGKLPAGVYVVTARDGTKAVTRRLVVR
ncbi:MAG: T9SS type A sorting domain-containing protein, partial [Cytophagales bacterium]|nr:T9SS type A sorting domain-containing protein [Cytophagales bacterium]